MSSSCFEDLELDEARGNRKVGRPVLRLRWQERGWDGRFQIVCRSLVPSGRFVIGPEQRLDKRARRQDESVAAMAI